MNKWDNRLDEYGYQIQKTNVNQHKLTINRWPKANSNDKHGICADT